MQIFITGTDTNIGKTLVASWICLHTGYGYFKPIQTGTLEISDTQQVLLLAKDIIVYKEIYSYQQAVSPHLAAKLNNTIIDLSIIKLPKVENLIIEGAGGLLVPINKDQLMIDLIKQLSVPVILVARSTIGTINHTLLSLEALCFRHINILGVILVGEIDQDNCDAIEFYSKTKVLAQIPILNSINTESLLNIPLTYNLQQILKGINEYN